jgi:hypothetical protein
VALFIGPQRERNSRPVGFGGGVNGGWPLRAREREAVGQRRFNGETEGGDLVLRFNSFQAREGDHWRRAVRWHASRVAVAQGKSWRKDTVGLG